MTTKNKITVRLSKSIHGRTEKVKSCVKGLGLRKIGDSSTLENTPSIRGMVKKVIYLLEVKE
jgi:large subunit ribosomal protein L30